MSPTGVVTAVGVGTTRVLVRNGSQSGSVDISIPLSIRGDLNADNKVNVDDVNILLAVLNTKAIGSFDARDLDEDGAIDNLDLQIMTSLCSLPGCATRTNVSPAAAISLSTAFLSFDERMLADSSTAQPVSLVNTGDAPLNIASISVNGDFTQTNACDSALLPLASCLIAVVFTPSATGPRTGAVTILGSGPGSPHVIGLSGSGAVPSLSFSSPSMSFENQVVGSIGTPQIVMLVNNSTVALDMTSITVVGDNPGDFVVAPATDCLPGSLPPGTMCALSTAFRPTASGDRSATITVTHNGPGSPNLYPLTGIGGDFWISTSGGASTTSRVTAGQTATYNLQVVPSSFSGIVSLECSGVPSGASCRVSASSLMLSGNVPASFAVTVTTSARGIVPANVRSGEHRILEPMLVTFVVLLLLGFVSATEGAGASRAIRGLSFVAICVVLLLIGCAGGGGSTTPSTSTNVGTLPGTSTLTVTASSGSASRSILLSLIID